MDEPANPPQPDGEAESDRARGPEAEAHEGADRESQNSLSRVNAERSPGEVGPVELGRGELAIGLGSVLLGVAYGLLHPLSTPVSAPIWFWIALPVVTFVVGLTATRQGPARAWFGWLVAALMPLGLALYDHSRALEAIHSLDDQSRALVYLWLAGAEARGVLVIGCGVAVVAAFGVDIISLRLKNQRSVGVSAQAWVALSAWALALVFGRIMLELPWSLEDGLAVASVAALAALLHLGGNLALSLWAPLVFVVLAWIRVDVSVALANGEESLYQPSLVGGLELARRSRLVVLDASASAAALLLLLWSLRSRLFGKQAPARGQQLLIIAGTWLALFGVERYINRAEKEWGGLADVLARYGGNLPQQELRVPGWLPKAPVWVVGRKPEPWAAPPRYQVSDFAPELLAQTSPRLSPEPPPPPPIDDREGGPRVTVVQGLSLPGVVLAAPAHLKLGELSARMGPKAGSAFGLLVRDSRVLRDDPLTRAATVRTLVVKLVAGLSELPQPERPDVRRYYYDVEQSKLVGPIGVAQEPVRLWQGQAILDFQCSRLSAGEFEHRVCEIVVGVAQEWAVARVVSALVQTLSPFDPAGNVSYTLVMDAPGVTARVREASP